jgi:hypothetical protein
MESKQMEDLILAIDKNTAALELINRRLEMIAQNTSGIKKNLDFIDGSINAISNKMPES